MTQLALAAAPDPAVSRAAYLAEAEGWQRPFLERLYRRWDEWNTRFFGGRLTPPYLVLSGACGGAVLGTCGPHEGERGRSRIRLRATMLTGHDADAVPAEVGTGPAHVMGGAVDRLCFEPGTAFAAGRWRVAADVLLHEMVHQFMREVAKEEHAADRAYGGHGPRFRDHCNRIGRELGLGPVRATRAGGRDRGLPSCGFWPECVRPPDYDLGATYWRYGCRAAAPWVGTTSSACPVGSSSAH